MEYYHDEEKRVVYAVPDEPQVSVKTERLGGRSYQVHVVIDITRADNYLEDGRWKYPLRDYRSDIYPSPRDREEDVVEYFKLHHYPKGEEITEEIYRQLRKQYEATAQSN